jgi:hemerythrin-like metal-binding protein
MGIAINPKDLVVGVAGFDKDLARSYRLWQDAVTVSDARFVHALSAFTDGLTVHFTREEHLMAAAGDGNLSQHRDEHDRLLMDLARFLGHSRAGKSHFARAFLSETFPDWLTRHIRTLDIAAAAHIRRMDLRTVA